MALKLNITSGAFLASMFDKKHGPIAQILVDSRKIFYFGFFLTAVTEILSIAPIIYMMNLFDRVLTSRSVTTLASITVLLLAVYVFSNALEWVRKRLLTRFAMRLDWDTSIDVFNASFRKFAGHKQVNIQQIMGDSVELRKFFQGNTFVAILQAPFSIMFAALAYFFHPWLCYFAFTCLAIMVVLAFLKQRAATPLMRAANQMAAENDRKVSESLRHSESALALGMMKNIRNNWYETHRSDLTVQANAAEASGLIGTLSSLLTRSLPQLSMGLMIYLAITGEVTGGMAIAGMFLISKTMRPIQTLMNEWQKLVRSKLALERLEKLLAEDESWKEKMPLPPPTGELDVSKIYAVTGNKTAILSGINFSLHPGQVLAIVGPSAAGKTTLVKHIVGISSPTSGSIRLDGAEIGDWIRSDDCPNIGYVPQETMLLEGSVADNIARMGDVAPEEVIKAANLVGMHRTILGFPEGYETKLGDTGYMLTGGQKQRILIARALYKMPKLVVMDEPSSSLDAQSEKRLMKTIDRLREQKCTVILTSHKPALVAKADMVLALDKGVQTGFGAAHEIAQQAKEQFLKKAQVQSDNSEKNLVQSKQTKNQQQAGNKPGAKNQQQAVNKPGAKNQQQTGNKPGAKNQPQAVNKPGAKNQQQAVNKPGAKNQQQAVNKPGAKNQQQAGNKPGAKNQPQAVNKPGAKNQQQAVNKPGAKNQQQAGNKPGAKNQLDNNIELPENRQQSNQTAPEAAK
jgi:PrtD family type I secretion system ABC transporter